jgi:hypothetical protein
LPELRGALALVSFCFGLELASAFELAMFADAQYASQLVWSMNSPFWHDVTPRAGYDVHFAPQPQPPQGQTQQKKPSATEG